MTGVTLRGGTNARGFVGRLVRSFTELETLEIPNVAEAAVVDASGVGNRPMLEDDEECRVSFAAGMLADRYEAKAEVNPAGTGCPSPASRICEQVVS